MEDLEAQESKFILFKQEKIGNEEERNFDVLNWVEDDLQPIPEGVAEELVRMLEEEDDVEVFEKRGRILITSEGVFVILHEADTYKINV